MWTLSASRADGCVGQLQFQMVCERPPAAFGGCPPQGGENGVVSPFQGRRTVSPLFSILLLPYCHGADRQDCLEILVRGRRERSERGGRSHIKRNCS